eukprot:321367-Pleurochrysis_carterae.AAC.1
MLDYFLSHCAKGLTCDTGIAESAYLARHNKAKQMKHASRKLGVQRVRRLSPKLQLRRNHTGIKSVKAKIENKFTCNKD